MRTLDFWLREAAQNLRRHALMSLAATGTVLMAMLLLGTSSVCMRNLKTWASAAADQAQVSVYMDREASREQARAVARQLSRLEGVRHAALVTKEAGFDRLRQQLRCDPALLDIPNPLSDAIKVWGDRPEALASVARTAQRLSGVRTVVQDRNTIRALTMVKRTVTAASLAMSAYLMLVALVIIHNTIRLTLHARRREVEIMQLLGATPAFIAGPFLLEGAAHGLLGALLAAGLVAGGYAYLLRTWGTLLPFLPLSSPWIMVDVSAWMLGAGVLLGVVGSGLSLRRYLRQHLAT